MVVRPSNCRVPVLSLQRYAVSVIWELEPETLEVLEVWYGRTVIRSAYKMTYKAAQTIVDLKDVLDEGGRSCGERILKALGGETALAELVPELTNTPKVCLPPPSPSPHKLFQQSFFSNMCPSGYCTFPCLFKYFVTSQICRRSYVMQNL